MGKLHREIHDVHDDDDDPGDNDDLHAHLILFHVFIIIY